MTFKFEVGELVKINDPGNQFHGQAGHVQYRLDEGNGAVYRVQFEGEVAMPAYMEHELNKIVSEPTQDFESVMEDRPEMLEDEEFDPQAMALSLVQILYYQRPPHVLDISEMYVVWFAKTLQNWKALISTNVKDDMYYEVTHNGDTNETYVDAYKKRANTVVNHITGEIQTNLADENL